MIAGNFYPQKANIKNNIKGYFPIATLLVCCLLLSGTIAFSQTYYSVSNLSGTSSAGGVNVNVTSVGLVSSFSCSGISQPYLEGEDAFSNVGTGSYSWTFSVPVRAIRLHIESIDAGDDVTISINGSPYTITSANISALLTGATCLGSTGTAAAVGGNLVNSGGGTNSATIDIIPGYGINSVSLQSAGMGSGVINDFTFATNSAPIFVNGNTELFSICESSGTINISSMLRINDIDTGQAITWTLTTAPSHGTAAGFPATFNNSIGDTVTPTGFTYTPATGFSGFDTIIVQVTDGLSTISKMLVVTVNPTPTLSSGLVIPAICNGPLSYTPTSQVAGTTFNWSRAFIGGISNAAASGTGDPNEMLDNVTYYSINVTYKYMLMASGCTDTQNVSVTVKPTPALSSVLTDTICNGDTVKYVPASATTGTVFTWSRAAIAGIFPATSSDTGNIYEPLNNTTPAPVNVIYLYTLNAGSCISTHSVTVTVNPAIPGTPITTRPSSTLCAGTLYQNFGASSAPGAGINYTWSAVNATIMAKGNNNQYSLVSFNNPGNASVTLTSNVPGSNCLTSDTYHVTVSTAENPSAKVIYYNYQFVYLDNTVDSYQWGYDNVTSLDSTLIAGASFQSYPTTSPNFVSNYYWVITTKNGCMQKTYYNAPLAVHNIAQGNTELKLYPNPASSSVTIDMDTPQGSIIEVSLTDMLGQTIKTISGTGHNMQINVADIPVGCYLVSCSQNGVKMATGRFIKN